MICGRTTVNQEHAQWADVREATLSMNPTTPLTVEREISVKEAYEIQKEFDKEMTKEFGEVTGYKVAYASKASQKLGISLRQYLNAF